ncbi:Sucrose synthase 3 [Zea mays]|uniref:sucrose synthase n=1 Tax=Zea mays TaxID=4577 RepID=A0A1D6IX24_MAIZE|nr:Sucrose synthase 3 [Zea mays]
MKKNLRKVPYDFMDVAGEIAAELQGTPDFIIGNYSDGNLMASLLSYKMGITHCNIAHALEKTKYPDSDIFWKNFDEKYHFSCQFTTDIVAMNNADFIITSTYQEIAGSGHLDDRSKPILFSMARLDRVKDITGLVEAFAKCAKLRELVNLVVVAGYNDVKKSKDREEIVEIEKMHELIKTHKLFGQFRWISAQTNRARNGELYRYIAHTHGAFVQAM